MRSELDQLVRARRHHQLEKERQLNMVEFSMNKQSLKQLGVIDKQTMDFFYSNDPPHMASLSSLNPMDYQTLD